MKCVAKKKLVICFVVLIPTLCAMKTLRERVIKGLENPSLKYCKEYIPPKMPNFAVPGRRISQVKCLEMMWGIKIRKEVVDNECSRPTILRGRNAKRHEFPHMAAIGWKASEGTWIFKCGGTLVSDKFVLTAGHCIKASIRDTSVSDPVPKIVRLGDNLILDKDYYGVNRVDVVISRIIPHPEYKSPLKYNDIALMEFEKPVKFTKYVHPACLWAHDDVSTLGTEVFVTGWGVVESGRLSKAFSPNLQVGVLDLIDDEKCNSLLLPMCDRNWWGLKNQICAFKLDGGVDTCQGDSGGPLQVRINLPEQYTEYLYSTIGLVSFGFGCGRANTPGVYTKVSSYIDWIERTVWGNQG